MGFLHFHPVIIYRFSFHLFLTDCSIFMSFPSVCWSIYFLKENAIISGVRLLLFWVLDTSQPKSCTNKNSTAFGHLLCCTKVELKIFHAYFICSHTYKRNVIKCSPDSPLIAFSPWHFKILSIYLHYKKSKTYKNVVNFHIYKVHFLLAQIHSGLCYPQHNTFTSEI